MDQLSGEGTECMTSCCPAWHAPLSNGREDQTEAVRATVARFFGLQTIEFRPILKKKTVTLLNYLLNAFKVYNNDRAFSFETIIF
jgi:hypothetical protein